MWQNSKTENVIKLKNWKCDQTQNSKFDKTQKLKIWQNSDSKYDKTQTQKSKKKSRTQNVTNIKKKVKMWEN